MIDSHAHLYWDSFKEDFDAVLQRAIDAGITHIINIGVDVETSQKAVEQAKEISALKVKATIGLHPHDSQDPTHGEINVSAMISQLEEMYLTNKEYIVAIGECGLDFYETNPSQFSQFKERPEKTDDIKEIQRDVFKAQVELAKRLNLPLVIHCRDAWEEIFDYLEGTKGVFHCYSGGDEETKRALEIGYYISFAGNVTFKKADSLRQQVSLIPLDRILIETDCPFLAPEGKRGERNEPSNVIEVAKTIAEVKSISVEAVMKQTSENTQMLFKIEED